MDRWSIWQLTEFVYGLNAARRGDPADATNNEYWVAGWWWWQHSHNASMPSVEMH